MMTDMTGKYRLWVHASAEQGKHDSETIVVTANKGVESGW
jgi:hypothetical protein